MTTNPTQNWEEELENLLRGNRSRGWLSGTPLSKIKSLITRVESSAIERTRKECVDLAVGMKQTSPNPLKAELVHNKDERNRAYYNKGYNQALTDYQEALQAKV